MIKKSYFNFFIRPAVKASMRILLSILFLLTLASCNGAGTSTDSANANYYQLNEGLRHYNWERAITRSGNPWVEKVSFIENEMVYSWLRRDNQGQTIEVDPDQVGYYLEATGEDTAVATNRQDSSDIKLIQYTITGNRLDLCVDGVCQTYQYF